jgi:hypothetical protein
MAEFSGDLSRSRDLREGVAVRHVSLVGLAVVPLQLLATQPGCFAFASAPFVLFHLRR